MISVLFWAELFGEEKQRMLQSVSGTRLLERMADTQNDKQQLESIFQSYYKHFFRGYYPSYEIFINCLILSPTSLPEKNHRILGNGDGINYGSNYLRYFAVLLYYGDDILFVVTRQYIDCCLINDDEIIAYGGETQDGKQVTGMLAQTLGSLIEQLKGKTRVRF